MLGLRVAPAEHRCCHCEGAGAPGDASATFLVWGLFAKSSFFFSPGTDIKGIYVASLGLSKYWFNSCFHRHAGRQRGATEESSNSKIR